MSRSNRGSLCLCLCLPLLPSLSLRSGSCAYPIEQNSIHRKNVLNMQSNPSLRRNQRRDHPREALKLPQHPGRLLLPYGDYTLSRLSASSFSVLRPLPLFPSSSIFHLTIFILYLFRPNLTGRIYPSYSLALYSYYVCTLTWLELARARQGNSSEPKP